MTGWLAGFALAAHAAASVQGEHMSLDKAIEIATQNAFSVRIAESNVEKARRRIDEIRGNLGPRVTGGASYTRFDRASQGGGIENKSAQLSLSMPLDLFGVTKRGLKGSERSLSAAQETLEASKRDLALAVRRAYFNVLQAEAQVIVAEETKGRAEQRLTNAKAQFAAGAIAQIDVLRLETAVFQAETDLISARNGVQLAHQAFNNTIARPIDTPVVLQSIASVPDAGLTDEELTKIALSNRREIKALQHHIAFLGAVRETQEGGMTPSLSLSAGHSRAFNGQTFSNNQTSGTLALTVPIWDSGITRARVKQARQDELQAKTQLEQVELGIALEVRQAHTNLQNASSRLGVARRQVVLAAETYRLAQIKFEAGEGIPLEVTDAQTELTRARTNEVVALYDALRAYAELQRAIGVDTISEPTPPGEPS